MADIRPAALLDYHRDPVWDTMLEIRTSHVPAFRLGRGSGFRSAPHNERFVAAHCRLVARDLILHRRFHILHKYYRHSVWSAVSQASHARPLPVRSEDKITVMNSRTFFVRDVLFVLTFSRIVI